MASVVINGDTSGSVTLQAPAVAGSTVVTLPTTSMNMGTGGGSVATNTAFGTSALAANTSGASGVAIGYQALLSNTTASNNTAVGYQAGYTNTTGTYLTAVGNQAAYSNTTGNANSAFGLSALLNNTTGANNTALGMQALNSNTTASNNTAVGYQAGYSNTTGTNNCAVGRFALRSCTTGTENTVLGTDAGDAITTGTDNTLVGYGAGYLMTTGSKNSILGTYSGNQGGLDIRTADNYIVLSDGDGNPRYYYDATAGDWVLNQITASYYCLMRYKNQAGAYFAVGTQSGASPNFQIFNPSGGGVYLGYAASSWTGVSDERLKNITGEISNGLNKVTQLRAVEFTWKRDETNESQVGLIAQDVQAVLPQAVSENDGHLGIRYTEVIPLLVAAIKELKAEFDAYKATHP
jgi:trimeric autotransporter adhesin